MDDLVAELRKQAHICQTSKAIGSITKDRCKAAMTEAAARITALETALAEARNAALEEAAKVAESGKTGSEHDYKAAWIAQAIRALASRHSPSPPPVV